MSCEDMAQAGAEMDVCVRAEGLSGVASCYKCRFTREHLQVLLMLLLSSCLTLVTGLWTIPIPHKEDPPAPVVGLLGKWKSPAETGLGCLQSSECQMLSVPRVCDRPHPHRQLSPCLKPDLPSPLHLPWLQL